MLSQRGDQEVVASKPEAVVSVAKAPGSRAGVIMGRRGAARVPALLRKTWSPLTCEMGDVRGRTCPGESL
jgi:hypothetical protein